MKSKYLRSGLTFCILVLAVFLAIAVFYTKSEIDDLNKRIEYSVFISSGVLYHFDGTKDELANDLQGAVEHYFQNDFTEGSGIYSSIIDGQSGQILVDSSDLNISGDPTKSSLNDEAHKKSDEYIKAHGPFSGGNGLYKTDDGIFRTTIMDVNNYRDNGYLVTHCTVFDPFMIVIRDNASTYLIGLAVFILVEAAILFSFAMLYKSQKDFEIRNQRLTRGIAHELKTPLAVTKATVENWEYLNDDQRREYSGNIVSEVDHMSDMVDRLIEVSQIKGGNVKPNRKNVDLLSLTREIKDRNNELMRERKIDMNIKADEPSYVVFADPDMMEIVIGNFMSNAIKYCDKKIEVRLVRSGKKITFSMANDGAMIEKKDLNKIWDIFYTTDKSRTNRIKNSGVGLSVVKSILDAHKARYGCTSDENETVFRFTMDQPAG